MEVIILKSAKNNIFSGYAFTIQHKLLTSIYCKCSQKVLKKYSDILITSNSKLKYKICKIYSIISKLTANIEF